MRKTTIALLAFGLSCLSTTAGAEGEVRQLGAHEHGHGKVAVAIEKGRVAMELEVPGMDIVGFEHEPSSKEQHEQIASARKALHDDVLKLFALPAAAACKLVAATVAIEAGEHEDEAVDGYGHGHGDHAADKRNMEAKPEKHVGGEEHEGHNEFRASYEFACAAPDRLTGIDFGFFARFPGAEELDVTVLDAKGQKEYEVSRETPKLEFQGQ